MNHNRFWFCLFFLCALCNAMPARLCAQSKSIDDYINAGLQNSPLLKEISNNILLNHIDSLRILAIYKPQVNGVSYNYAAPVVHGFGYDGAISNVYNVAEQVSATQLLVSKRNLRIQFNGIQLLNDSLTIAGKISEQDLKRTITAAYIAAYGSWRQYSFNKEVYDLLSAEDTILKRLTQVSVYRQTDYLTFLVTLQQQHLLITQAKTQYQSDFATLNYLSGLFDTTLQPLDSPRIEIAQLPEMNASIFYQKFTVDSLLLRNAGQQIDLAYRPRVTLGADAGYVSSFQYTPLKNWGASASVNVIVPIYDGRQRRLSHKRLDILENTRQNYRDFFATQYNQQIAQLTQQLNNTKMLIAETSNQLKYVRALIVANSKLLATGDVRIADYVIAINNFLNAQNVVIQNTVNQFQIITQINYWNRR